MISVAVAVTTVNMVAPDRASQAREARFPRFVGLLLDTIFFSLIWSIANAVFGVTRITWGSPAPPGGGTGFYGTDTAVAGILAWIIYAAYFAVFEAVFGGTPGKLLNGLRVVTVDGQPLTVGRVIIRNLLRLIDALPVLYLIGVAFMMVTRNSQRLGDVAAGTTVVNKRYAQTSTIRANRTVRRALYAFLAAVIIFTAGFDYFGRPALVIQGLYNQHQLMGGDLVSYSLGQPTWSWGSVTYPIKGRTATTSCTGWIQLYWEPPRGWQMGNGQLNCPPIS